MDYMTCRGNLDCLTEEERYELELSFAESDEWYDEYPDENSPEEIAWSEYMIDQAKFTYEAVSFYKRYLEYRGEKKPSPELLSIFKYNINLLNYFLNRIKEGDKQGTDIVCEFQAIMFLQKDMAYKLVDESRKLEPLRVALSNIGFVTKTKQNWSDGFGKKHQNKVSVISKEYRAFLERNQ